MYDIKALLSQDQLFLLYCTALGPDASLEFGVSPLCFMTELVLMGQLGFAGLSNFTTRPWHSLLAVTFQHSLNLLKFKLHAYCHP